MYVGVSKGCRLRKQRWRLGGSQRVEFGRSQRLEFGGKQRVVWDEEGWEVGRSKG